MKKLFALVLVMVLVLSSLTACSVDEVKGKVTETFNTVKEKVTDTFDTVKRTVGGWFGIEFHEEEPPAPEVIYDVEAAKDYVYQLYVKGSYETPVDYNVVKQVFIKKVAHDVTWTTSSELVKVIVNENDVTIDVDEKATEDLVYTITATITGGDGTSATVSFERMVPKYELLTHAQYLEKETGDSVTIEGIVTLARSQGAGNTRDQLFIQDMSGEGGYYVYFTTKDHVKEDGLKVGMKVSVTGIKEVYGKTHEIKDAAVTILDTNVTNLTPTDITDLFKANTDPKADALRDKLGMLVTIKSVVIGGQDLSEKSKYLYFEIEGGCETYVRVYTTDLGVGIMTAEQEAQIFADHLAKRDYLANVTGVVDVYSDAIYISPVGPTPFEFLTKVERTPAEKIEISLDELEVPESVDKAGEITLPTAGTTYPEVSFAWSTDSEFITIDGGKLTVTLPEETTTVTLTLKANCEGATEVVKTYNIKLVAPATNPFLPEKVEAPEVETAYKFYVYNAHHGKNFYFTGAIDGKYLQSSENTAEAVDVFAEKVLGEDGTTVLGYRFYFDNAGTKTYIDINASGAAALVTENPASVYNYVAETGAWSNGTYYIGSYLNTNTQKSYTTFGASQLKYIDASNTGVTQYPANLATLKAAAYAPEKVEAPEVETAYKFYVYNAHHGKNFYFTGAIDGKYLQSSENTAEAVDVFAEKVLGEDGTTVLGYRFYFDNAGTKTYIDINASGAAALVTENPASVYNYVAETGAWSNGTYYIGSYLNTNTQKSYTTFGASQLKYIDASNTGVTQYPANLATLVAKLVGPEKVDTPEVETAYKFYVYNAHHKDNFYFTGIIDGKYLQSSNNIYDGVDVFAEKVLGEDGTTVLGYRFYFDNAGTKTYIDINASGAAALVTENPASVYNYVAETGAWSNGTYYIGSYLNTNTQKSYTTFGASQLKYIDASNTGVTQYPANLAIVVFVEDEVVEPDEPDTPDTPDTPGEINLPMTDDIATSTSSDASSYGDRTTTNGWSATKTALISGKAWMGENVFAWAINGKKDNCGTITSPVINGALSYMEFNYGFPFSDTKFKVKISLVSTSGTELVSTVLEKTDLTKEVAYSFRWVLTEAEAAKVTGEYKVVIENLALSNYTSGNKDRLAIWNIKLSNEAFVVSDAEKVAAEKAALALDMTKVNLDRVITLPTSKEYTDVAITWAVSENTVATLADGKLTVTTGEAAEKITLTATLKCGDVTETKTFDVEVSAKSPITVTKVTAPEAGKAYKIYLRQFIADNIYFVNGNVVSEKYLGTTTSIEDAIDVYVEVVEGGFKFYGGNENNKMYVNVDAAGAISLAAADGNVFKYDAEKNCWYTNVVTSAEGAETVTNEDYYLGSYEDYDTISASKLKYITKDNTGITQFPAELVTIVCNHVWAADCDTTCDYCGETRAVNASHTYDALCTDADCNACGEKRQAPAAHTYDDDCADTTCNVAGCTGTREAQEHDFGNDCTVAKCVNCAVTREAEAAHKFDDDCQDTTCNNEGCNATREAQAHVYDDDCQDTTCNNCTAGTREAKDHVYDNDCQDTTCDNCAVTRENASHYFPYDCSDECSKCGEANPDAVECVDALDKSGETPVEGHDNKCDHCGKEMDQAGDTTPAPVGEEN